MSFTQSYSFDICLSCSTHLEFTLRRSIPGISGKNVKGLSHTSGVSWALHGNLRHSAREPCCITLMPSIEKLFLLRVTCSSLLPGYSPLLTWLTLALSRFHSLLRKAHQPREDVPKCPRHPPRQAVLYPFLIPHKIRLEHLAFRIDPSPGKSTTLERPG